jgi:asparagine synthase (glutamine-hydrolysing)
LKPTAVFRIMLRSPKKWVNAANKRLKNSITGLKNLLSWKNYTAKFLKSKDAVMCGIGGIFMPKRLSPVKEIEKINQILATQFYRGPDRKDIQLIESPNNHMIMGHNRLSIVDLHGSNQPMWDENKNFCIAYNGMLYNYIELRNYLKERGHTFSSAGDTEVILKAFIEWGDKAFTFFNGMFAIAIYNKIEEKLYLARDRFGVKPLFYSIQQNRIYFASTSSELARQLNLQPNLAMLAKGLHYWSYECEAETVYQDLSSVTPSEFIIFENKYGLKKTANKYYDLTVRVNTLISTQRTVSLRDSIKKVDALIHDAVKIRLRADVNLGVSLSGGIDSTLIASIIKKMDGQYGQITAFSFGSLHDSTSEAKMAKLAADNAELSLAFVNPTAKEMQEGFWQTLTLQDAPFPNLSIVAQYLVFNAAHQQGVKVMLGGQGADEIFMGYRKYLYFHLQHLFQQKKYFSALFFLSTLIPLFFCESKNLTDHLFNIKRYTNRIHTPRWEKTPVKLGITKSDPLWKRQFQDIYFLSLPTLLRYEDRNSMGNSIESRLPFLDYRVVELALALPETLKLHRGYSKWILREIAKQYLPQEITSSLVKRGFNVESRKWICSGLGESLRDRLKSRPALLKRMDLENKVDHLFSDQSLYSHPFNLAECITLAWLAQKDHFVWS